MSRLVLPLLLATSLLAADRPNIVVLLADDHSAADMSVYGAKDIPTPHLEGMAAAGMVFEKAFVNSPSCAPSRAALFTGMFPARNGAEPNHSKPREDIKRIPAYLKQLGYEVVSFGKTSHYAHVKEQGFDLVQGFEMHDHSCVQASIDFLKQRKSEKPLALFFGTHWPHVPLPPAEGVEPATVRIQPMHIDTPEFRAYRARYVNAVMKMDEEIGAVYAAAKETLGVENTFFLQTADHGAQLPFGKWNLYDAGIRVPLIVQWAGKISPGTRTQAMAQWIDILPTLLDVAGGAAEDELDGRSLVPVLTGQAQEHREAIFTTHTGDGSKNVYPCRSMRTQRWHYIRNLHPEFRHGTHIDRVLGDERNYWLSWEKAAEKDAQAANIIARYRERPADELYDLEADPYELNNLAADSAQADRVKEMSAAVDAWMKSNADTQMVAGAPSLLSEPFTMAEVAPKKKRTLKPDANLQDDAAPRIAMRPFTIGVHLEKSGTQGVLAAQGGTANGWALFLSGGEVHFMMNRNSQREITSAKLTSAKLIEASIGPNGVARILLDGAEVAKKPFGGLLPVQPIDGFQVGRDLAAPVGDYTTPFAFIGVISTATLEIGDEVPTSPFVGSAPAGGAAPSLPAKVSERAQAAPVPTESGSPRQASRSEESVEILRDVARNGPGDPG